MRFRYLVYLLAVFPLLCCSEGGKEGGEEGGDTKPSWYVNTGNYSFSGGKISREVLDNYLSRAVTEAEYLCSPGNYGAAYGTDDDTRMLLNIGAKFIGRSIYVWGNETLFNHDAWLSNAKKKVDAYHAKDPDAIFQAAMFEAIYKSQIEQIKVPDWVFKAFGLTPEDRSFNYYQMCFEDGSFKDQWGFEASVPDMTRQETQMWFYFMGVKYMEAGIEAFHLGQIDLICKGEKGNYSSIRKVMDLLREAAKTKARRGTILFDAHSTTGGTAVGSELILDFTSFPLRLREITNEPMKAILRAGYLDSIIGRTNSGTTPSGWKCSHQPYILEFDNFGTTDHPGKPDVNSHTVWGYDEISWISQCSEDYQNEFFEYAVDFLYKNDPNGFIQMPGLRLSVGGTENIYRVNTRSNACPDGHNGEETIKRLWSR